MDNNKTEMINIQLLSPHPRNKDIYGQEDIKDLADKIKQSNFIKPFVVNQNNIIISGHRRCYACIYLGITEVPITREVFTNENKELERLLLENEYREKTLYQKEREAELWEEIEREKAKLRKLSTQNNNQGELIRTDMFKRTCLEEKGTTRKIVAEKAGISSEATYMRAKFVVKKMDDLIGEGKSQDAEFLKKILNENASFAHTLAKLDSLINIPNELKQKTINNELNIQNAIAEIKNCLKKNKESKKETEEEKIPEPKICKQCGKEKSVHEYYEGRNICSDCYNENVNKRKVPKDVYGNEIKIDKEKIKGIDIESVLANIKDTNKSINNVDYDAISMEFQCNIEMFIRNIGKYIEMNDTYKLESIDKVNKDIVIKSIEQIENTMNQIKNILI